MSLRHLTRSITICFCISSVGLLFHRWLAALRAFFQRFVADFLQHFFLEAAFGALVFVDRHKFLSSLSGLNAARFLVLIKPACKYKMRIIFRFRVLPKRSSDKMPRYGTIPDMNPERYLSPAARPASACASHKV